MPANRQTDTHTDMLIVILHTLPGGKNQFQFYPSPCCC